ncbi:DUF6383 domain-containing protein [Parabacteroides segnis]|uniref:DUF6383 domain-containing protein n=1 Tax=Parabacteroides segnis TaxID=2763058 RepID=UPI00351573F4
MNKKISTLLAAALVVGSMSSSVMAKDVVPNGERYYQLVESNKALTYASKDGKDSLVVVATANLKNDLDAYKKSLWSVKAEGTNYVFTNRVLGTTLSISTTGVTGKKDAAAYLGAGIAAFAADKTNPLKVDDATFAPSSTDANKKVKLFSNIPAADLTKKDSVYYLAVASDDVVRVKKDAANTNATEFTLTSAAELVPLSVADLNALGNDAFKLTFLDAKGAAIETTLDNPFTSWMTAKASPILKTGAKFENYAALSTAIGKAKEGQTAATGIYSAIEKIDAYKKAYDEYLAVVNGWIAAKAGKDDEKVTDAKDYTAKKGALLIASTSGAAYDLLASTTDIENLFTNAEKMKKAKKGDATVEATSLGLYQAFEKVTAAVNTQLYSVKTNVATLNANLASLVVINQEKTGAEFKALDAYKAADKAAKAIDDVKTLCASTVQSYFQDFATKLGAVNVTVAAASTDGYVTLQNADGQYIAVDTTYIAEADKHLGYKLEKDASKIFGFPYTASFKVSQVLDNPKVDELIIKTYAFTAPTGKAAYSETYKNGGYSWDSANGTITPATKNAEVVIRTLGTSGNYRKEVSVEITDNDATLRKNATIVFAEPAAATLEAGIYKIFNATTDLNKKDLAAVSYKQGGANQKSLASAMIARSASDFVPSTQWNVTVENGVYKLVNREYKDSVICKLYDVEGQEGLYTNTSKDTIRVEKVTITGDAAHVGYKHYTPEVMEIGTFSLKMKALNQPTDFYVYMNADSVLMADATDAEKALKLVALDGKAGVERKLTDNSLSATTYQLVVMDTDGETPLYLTNKDNGTIVLSTKATTNTIELKATSADQYMVVWGKDDIAKNDAAAVKVFTVNQDGYILLTPMNAPNNYTFNLMNVNAPKYWNMKDANGYGNSVFGISFESALKNILLSVKDGMLATRDLNELGAKEDTLSVGFKLDTAFVDRENNFRPAYYISQNRVEMADDSIQANYLYVATDTLKNGTKEGKKMYSYNDFARLAMTPAIHIGDKMLLGADKKEATKTQLDNFNFAFKKIEDTDYAEGYKIEARFDNASWGELAVINTIPVVVKAGEGETFSNAVGGGAVDNEKVEVSSVSVTTVEGQVIVKGAQGKKVTISNVLGQTIASTVLSSDEATIAAPAGYVTVAIEGEAAVKAIVK